MWIAWPQSQPPAMLWKEEPSGDGQTITEFNVDECVAVAIRSHYTEGLLGRRPKEYFFFFGWFAVKCEREYSDLEDLYKLAESSAEPNSRNTPKERGVSWDHVIRANLDAGETGCAQRSGYPSEGRWVKREPARKWRNQNPPQSQLHNHMASYLVGYEIKIQKLRWQMFVGVAQSWQMVLLVQ